jgi:all-beta uncharacterized protein
VIARAWNGRSRVQNFLRHVIEPVAPAAVMLIAATLVSSCSSSSQTETITAPSTTKCGVQVSAESSSFPPAGGSASLRVTTSRECPWSAKSNAPWVTLSSPVDGQGEGSIKFTVVANGDPSSRSASLSVNDQRVQISQEGKPCAFTLSSNHESVEGTGGNRSIDVRASAAQCSWTAAPNVAWITIAAGREGRGNGTVTAHVDPVTGPPRIGTITVAGQNVQVDQGTGCSYAIGTDTFTLDAGGGDRQVPVTAPPGCPWTAESGTAWVTVTSGSSGNGGGVVGFRVEATNGPARTGTLTVAGHTVTVTQSPGCAFSVSAASLSVGASGGTSSIQVQTSPGCAWSSASGVPWITLSAGTTGSGPGPAQLSVAANVGPARIGSVTIAGQAVQIAQADGCTFAVAPSTQDVTGNGATGAASITTGAGCGWTATTGVDWITVSPHSGSGPGQASYSVAPNLSAPRSGTITIAGQAITINQASQCTWAFAPPSHEFSATGGFGTVLVFVSGQCNWTAVSNADWIQVVAGASGVGGGLFQFTAAENPGGARTGTLTVGGQTYIVNEAGR